MKNNNNQTPEENQRVFRGDTWDRLFNPLIMETIKKYVKSGGVLFGLTGDLDNLGVYVARNGRPLAENLVDFYNQVIRNYLKKWTLENKDHLFQVVFVPSGEEVLIIGVAKDRKLPDILFKQIKRGVMDLASSQPFIPLGDTSTSFGGVVFDNRYDDTLKFMIDMFERNEPDSRIYPVYLEVLMAMRQEMAKALDQEKFSNILGGKFPVQLRQIVYAKMLNYKTSTKKVIEALNLLSLTELEELLRLTGNQYGLAENKENLINQTLKYIHRNAKSKKRLN